jgi:serine/threonine protein phosphatase PrpC
VGVSPIPEINIYDISPDDRIIIIASDGVWEFLSNDRVAEIVMKFYENGHAE